MQNIDNDAYSKTVSFFHSLGGNVTDEEILSFLMSALQKLPLERSGEELTVLGIYRMNIEGGSKKLGM